MNRSAPSRASCMSTPRNWTRSPQPVVRRRQDRRLRARTASHHDAQKFTTTGVPRSDASSSSKAAGSVGGRAAASRGQARRRGRGVRAGTGDVGRRSPRGRRRRAPRRRDRERGEPAGGVASGHGRRAGDAPADPLRRPSCRSTAGSPPARTGVRTKGPEACVVLERAARHRDGRASCCTTTRAATSTGRASRRCAGSRLGEPATIVGTVTKASSRRTRRNQTMVTVTVGRRHGPDRPRVLQPTVGVVAPYQAGDRAGGVGRSRSPTAAGSSSRTRRSRSCAAATRTSSTPAASRRSTPRPTGISARTIRALLWRALEQLAPLDRPAARRRS